MAEKKFLDTSFWLGANTINRIVTGKMAHLTPIERGSEDIQRIGDKVTLTSLEIRMIIRNPGFIAQAGTDPAITPVRDFYLRVVVFVWKDDSTPTTDDIFDQATNLPADYATLLSAFDNDRKVKRKVLMDEQMTFYADTTTTNTGVGGTASAFFTRKFNMSKLKYGLNTVNFMDASTTAPINGVYMAVYSNGMFTAGAAGLNTNWDVLYKTRVRYVDL